MEKQLLVYQRAVPVSSERHQALSVDTGAGYGFARKLNAVPIVIGEFAKVAREYPIIFVPAGKAVQPMALVGLRTDENLFVGDDGNWTGSYVPAFLRRYPFVFHHRQDKDNYVLCIDRDYAGVNEAGQGQALFGADGGASSYLKAMLDFTTTYQKEAQATQLFSARVQALGILEEARITFKVADGSDAATRGMQAVDRAALNDLDGDALKQLLQSGDLELLYAHLFSLANTEGLGDRLRARAKPRIYDA